MTVLSDLEERLRALSAAPSAATAFAALLDGMRLAAPRGAVFLVKGRQLRGWRSFGYDDEVRAAQRGFACGKASRKGWLEGLAAAPEGGVRELAGAAPGAEFGQPVAAASAGTAVTVAGRAVAVLLIERGDGETPWHPAALGVLASVARLRLTLIVEDRRGGAATAEPSVASRPAAPPAVARPLDDDERVRDLAAARRFARLVATDIRLYHEEAVVLGRRNGDLAERLSSALGRGKESFLERHAGLGADGLGLLHEALVQVLAGGDASLLPPNLLD